jgi:hypothetical protein
MVYKVCSNPMSMAERMEIHNPVSYYNGNVGKGVVLNSWCIATCTKLSFQLQLTKHFLSKFNSPKVPNK